MEQRTIEAYGYTITGTNEIISQIDSVLSGANTSNIFRQGASVAIVGKPNAGKSTLLNSLLDRKIAITAPKAQTTRNAILGIMNGDDYQIVFVDTPGIHDPSTHLGSYMNKEAYNQAFGADIIYYLVDGNSGLRDDDREILDKLFSYEVPIFLLVNKIDEISNDKLIQRLAYGENNYDFAEIIPISAKTKDNLHDLINTTLNYLTDSVAYYPSDTVSVNSDQFMISEIIREKIIMNTEKEIPHLTAVSIDTLKQTEKRIKIEATITVNKNSHKALLSARAVQCLKESMTQLLQKSPKYMARNVFYRSMSGWMKTG